MSELLCPDTVAMATPLTLLSPQCESVLSQHLASLPPGQATHLLQLFTHHLQASLDHAPLGVGVAHSVVLLCVMLARLPEGVWLGRCGHQANTLTCTLVEELCPQLLLVARTEMEAPPPATPTIMCATALLLTCQCRQLLTRLHLAEATPTKWPLDLCPGPAQQLLPIQWVGVAMSHDPATQFLLVSELSCVW